MGKALDKIRTIMGTDDKLKGAVSNIAAKTEAKPQPQAQTQTVAAPQAQVIQQEDWFDTLMKEAPSEISPDEKAKIEKRRRSEHRIAALGDAIGSIANLAGAANGATVSASPNLTDAARQRYNVAEATRKQNDAIHLNRWQTKISAISDRAKLLQEQEKQRREEEYRTQNLSQDQAKFEETKRSNKAKEDLDSKQLEQEIKASNAEIERRKADAYEARKRGDSYTADKAKTVDFVVGNTTVQLPDNLLGNNAVGRANLVRIYNEVVPDKYKEQLNSKLTQRDSFGSALKDEGGNSIYDIPSQADLEYYISTYGEADKLQSVLGRITGTAPTQQMSPISPTPTPTPTPEATVQTPTPSPLQPQQSVNSSVMRPYQQIQPVAAKKKLW